MFNANKRKRENETHEDQEADRVTKKLKCDLLEIDALPEELIMQILVRVPKKNLEELSETSTQWRKITRSRDFWRLSCQYEWASVVASDNIDIDQKEYAIPVVKFARQKVSKVIELIAEQSPGFPSVMASAVSKIISNGSELQCGTLASVLEMVPILSLMSSVSALFTVPVLDLAFDMAVLRYNRGENAWLISTIMLLDYVLDSHRPKAKVFSFCRRAYGLLPLVRDNSNEELIQTLIKVIAQLLRARTVHDERSKQLYRMVIEYIIGMGPLDLGKDNYLVGALVFQRPFRADLLKQFTKIRESFTPMMIETASRMYHTSDDWKIKASAIAVAWNSSNQSIEYTEKYCELAIHAAKQSESEVAFVGLVGLYNIVRKSDDSKTQFNAELATTIFQIITEALTKYNADISLQLYQTLWEILPAIQSDLVSDELLNQFMNNVIDLFARLDHNQNAAQVEDKYILSFERFGTKFKGRLVNYLERLKTALFSLNKARFPAERVLQCYVDIGIAMQEDAFATEFRQLSKQIVDGTLPFKVSVVECYGRMAEASLHFAESEEERKHIITQLFEAIPKEVMDFGQSGVFEEQQQPETGPGRLPNTYQEILDQYGGEGLDKITVQVDFRDPDYFVLKQNLTPVNPSGITRADKGEGISREIAESHLYASRLLMMVIKNDGKYVQHAQKILHAMLAPYRLLFKSEWHHAILALLVLVRPEMEPREFLKYIEIIIHTLANQIDSQSNFSNITKQGISHLFGFCFGLLEPCGVSKASTIRNAINAYLLIYDYAVPKFMKLDQFIYYLITTWPRMAYEAIIQSNLANWLVSRVKTLSLSMEEKMPLLFVFATAGVFYSVGFVSEHICVDDPEEDAYESGDQYLARIMPDCRTLYQLGLDREEGFEMNTRQLKILRNFLILYAIDVAHGIPTEISMLSIPSEYQEYLLKTATTCEVPFDTGVYELDSLVKELDLAGICKLLSIKYEEAEEEKEEVDDDYESDEDEENNEKEDDNNEQQ